MKKLVLFSIAIACRYHASIADAQASLPYDSGFESVNIVAAVGPGVGSYRVGDTVATLSYNGFAEYGLASATQALQVGALAGARPC